jgi:phosphocarrier protein FPr
MDQRPPLMVERIEVVANIAGPADAEQVIQLGGEGVGLLRSEFLFMSRVQAPTEDEQFEAYSTVARTLGPGRPLIIRTLDVGGDKPLAYLPIPPEENPFLGERGIRVGLNRPDMLRDPAPCNSPCVSTWFCSHHVPDDRNTCRTP